MLILGACSRDQPICVVPNSNPVKIPAGFPDIDYPVDNVPTAARIALGRQLFYDKRLSRNQTVSCADCHHPNRSFSDNRSFSEGENNALGFRNAPALHNVGYHTEFFKDGGSPTLELMVQGPIEDPVEMNFNLKQAGDRLKTDQNYMAAARNAYDREMGPYVIARGLACFVRTLISGNARYDQIERGEGNYTTEEQRGKDLFFGAAQCATCHSGFDFSNRTYQNIGLYTAYPDSGRARITFQSTDRGKFKVPSLRNIAVTGPYMHDGSLTSLEQVMDHYQAGGKGHPNQHPVIAQMQLTNADKADLIAFLRTLTDDEFLNNTNLSNP